MLYTVELLKAEGDAKQAEFDANLEARVFAGNFDLWKEMFYEKPHEEDIDEEEVEWATSPDDVMALLRDLQQGDALS
jgi:hypothetical protein